jgi:hypothetical protein
MVTTLQPEHRLILAAVRRAFGQELQLPWCESIDWQRFTLLATRHGIAPLVQAGLEAAAVSPPADARRVLALASAASAVRFKISLEPTLRLALAVLGDVGLEPVVLKGAALAYLAYPKPGYRTLADLDLLVPDGDLERAHDALITGGFRQTDADRVPLGHHHLPPYVTPDGRFTVELHRHVLPAANPFAVQLAGLKARSCLRQVAGVQARVLAPADALMHVCLHLAYGHRYRWYPLRSFADILAIVSGPEPIDWDAMVGTTRASRTQGAVYWPLWLAREWLGAPIPNGVLDQLAPPLLLRRVIAAVLDSEYVIDSTSACDPGAEVLYGAVSELSLLSGCPSRQQLGAFLRCLFPGREAVGHLPHALTSSRLQYGAHLGRPRRLARGVFAVGRLLALTPRRTSGQHLSVDHMPAFSRRFRWSRRRALEKGVTS